MKISGYFNKQNNCIQLFTSHTTSEQKTFNINLNCYYTHYLYRQEVVCSISLLVSLCDVNLYNCKKINVHFEIRTSDNIYY